MREEENQNKDKQNEQQDETEKSAKNKTQEFTPESFRGSKILASSAKNLILLDLGMCVAFPTIVIPSIQNATGPLSFDDEETSWFGERHHVNTCIIS
uniref:Uncharacterized protein n=1 Tax=Timema poppense TaxID=170557 RepID=A0A7R9DGB2_TIMPO|nr:unnamed protein product [Timema poppensis]